MDAAVAVGIHPFAGASVASSQAMESLRMFDGAIAKNGVAYRASVCGQEREDGKWEGWIEFASADAAQVWRTDRETTQPNRTDLLYWASGLSTVFLEGALDRALTRQVA